MDKSIELDVYFTTVIQLKASKKYAIEISVGLEQYRSSNDVWVDQRQVVRRNVQIGVGQHHEHRAINDGRAISSEHCTVRLDSGSGISCGINILQRCVCHI